MNRDTLTDQTPDLFEALAEAAGKMEAIAKDQRNTQQNFAFRSIEAIVGHAKPILKEAGVSVIPVNVYTTSEEVESGRGTKGWRTIATVTYRIGHKSGQSILAEMAGEAVDYGDKSTTKAAQMAYKYLLTQMLGIGSEDPDAESPEAVARPEQPRPKEEDPTKRRINAVKAEIYKAADGDADAAKSVWEGLLDGLGIKEDAIGEKRIEKIEEAWKERPLADEKEDE